ncbi:hypothetical protein PCG10_006931 [Penicillium crustosum]|uniref:Uncharacterized protein n=1 Tax=Penicillium crustosum TaxID=36656 RepID=A0A9P5GH98_PENCR|nr:uncharacterized protein N7487_007236 [Penicillium crustosum]KAF7522973.1 hypothetical protein PCG10_006931 [Penicillium crustosum]KAJ5401340.1 hypothetical protein N7487_007236 [Penicillium crustosum]
MREKHIRKNCELQPVTMSHSLTATSLDIEAKAKPSSSSSHGVSGTRSAIASDNSSPGNSDSSSDDGSDTFSSNGSDLSSPTSSSPITLNTTFPESNVLKISGLFDDYHKENPNTQPIAICDTSSLSNSDAETVILRNPAALNNSGAAPADNCNEISNSQSSATWDTSSQSESDAETVILCNAATNNHSDAVSAGNPGSDESGAVCGGFIQGDHDVEKNGTSGSASDKGSDSSSQNCSDTFSLVGPHPLSPTSSTTSSQASLDIDDDDDDEVNYPKGSHKICAYASPVQDGRRIRTSCDSNDDTGIWHVEPDGFINESQRAGGPFLCSFPVKMQKLKPSDPLSDVLEDCVLVRKILATLAEHNVYPISMKLRECKHENDFFNWKPTLIFSAIRNTFDDSWILACRQVWKHFSDAGLAHLNIEISDPDVYTFFLRCLEKSDPLWPVSLELNQRIMATIDHTDMQLLSMPRVGMNQSEKTSPAVLMTVRLRSNRDWRNTRDQIVEILDDFNLPTVEVIIMKGENSRG